MWVGGRMGVMRMREILFRGKTIAYESKWVEGFYNHIPCGRFLCDEHCIQTINEDGKIGQLYDVYESTVGQFTGLTDKNGKMIFEGDICKVGNLIYKVVFEYSCWWFKILSNKVYCCPAFNSHCGERCEVIGNIHDNPELLGGAEDAD